MQSSAVGPVGSVDVNRFAGAVGVDGSLEHEADVGSGGPGSTVAPSNLGLATVDRDVGPDGQGGVAGGEEHSGVGIVVVGQDGAVVKEDGSGAAEGLCAAKEQGGISSAAVAESGGAVECESVSDRHVARSGGEVQVAVQGDGAEGATAGGADQGGAIRQVDGAACQARAIEAEQAGTGESNRTR